MLSNTLFTELLEAIQESMWNAGYQVFVGITHYEPKHEAAQLESYLSHRPAGIILTGLDRDESQRRLIENSRTPCIYTMELSKDLGIHCVALSQCEAVRTDANHLLDRGRRPIAYVGDQIERLTQRKEE